MGVLSGLGQGIAQGTGAGATDPNSLTRTALGYGAATTLGSSIGSLAQGLGGWQQAQFAGTIARENAQAALAAGQLEQEASKMRYGALEHKQIAGFAGAGVGVGGENVRATVATTAAMSDMDAKLLQYNAERAAYGSEEQQVLAKREGMTAISKGLMGVGASYLAGASSLASKWAAFQQYGGRNTFPAISDKPMPSFDDSTFGAP